MVFFSFHYVFSIYLPAARPSSATSPLSMWQKILAMTFQAHMVLTDVSENAYLMGRNENLKS